jgi:hypothetical protein
VSEQGRQRFEIKNWLGKRERERRRGDLGGSNIKMNEIASGEVAIVFGGVELHENGER